MKRVWVGRRRDPWHSRGKRHATAAATPLPSLPLPHCTQPPAPPQPTRSPSPMKQMPAELRLSAVASPAAAAKRRTSALLRWPTGNSHPPQRRRLHRGQKVGLVLEPVGAAQQRHAAAAAAAAAGRQPRVVARGDCRHTGAGGRAGGMVRGAPGLLTDISQSIHMHRQTSTPAVLAQPC